MNLLMSIENTHAYASNLLLICTLTHECSIPFIKCMTKMSLEYIRHRFFAENAEMLPKVLWYQLLLSPREFHKSFCSLSVLRAKNEY